MSNGTALATTNGNAPAKAPILARGRGLELRSIDEFWRFAGVALQAKIVPRGLDSQEKVMIALQYGAELGFPPMQSLATVMVVNGRPSLYGDGMLAIAQASGQLEDYREDWAGDADKPDTMAATVTAKRRGRPTPAKATFAWKDAKRAGLIAKDLYKAYPQRMLTARARAFALRAAFPEYLTGVLSVEEAQELAPLDGAPVEPAFVDGAQQPTSDLDQLIESDSTVVEPEVGNAPSEAEQEAIRKAEREELFS